MRGRRHRRAPGPGRRGKIPARAGTTPVIRAKPAAIREDPRACEDDWQRMCPGCRYCGRSPRVRGRRLDYRKKSSNPRKIPARAGTTPGAEPPAGARHDGKIPARAGTTVRVATPAPSRQEDPRACGDDASSPLRAIRASGRSPRVRGRPYARTAPLAVPRKIPARAGTTVLSGLRTEWSAEDPRACGDDDWWMVLEEATGGRSPRVRGRPDVGDSGGRQRRKIPARAGTTHRSAVMRCRPPEDPRACGDDASAFDIPVGGTGRSPRVRGRRGGGSGRRGLTRKIPARAGTTCGSCCGSTRPAEDPRACGDDSSART